jgi:hypothetical protein
MLHDPNENKIDDIKNKFYEKLFDNLPKYHMKMLLWDFNAKVGREGIFKPTIGNEIRNDNGVRIVNFATSKSFTVKSTMFPHRNIYNVTWTSPDGRTHNQIDHILIDDVIQVYLISDHSGQMIVILTTTWWWQRLGKGWQ